METVAINDDMHSTQKPAARRRASFFDRETIRLFVVGYAVSALAFTAIVLALTSFWAERELQELKVQEQAKVAKTASILGYRFDMIASDLLTLANVPTMRALAADSGEIALERAANLFSTISREKGIYHKISYLDANGVEVIRVDQRGGLPVEVPVEHLQNKGGQYFVQAALRLERGEIYVSPLDLNVENGQIERPYNPTIQFGTPIFGPSGERRGIMMLNLHGQSMIDRFRELMADDYSQAMLLSSSGDWLASPDPAHSWEFMLRRPGAFAQRHPQAWQAISGRESGQWMNADAGLFTYSTLHPGRATEPGGKRRGEAQDGAGNEHFWKVVSLVPAAALPSAAIGADELTRTVYLAGLALLLVLAAYVAHAVVTQRRLRHAIERSNRRHREITQHLGEGLIVLDRDARVVEANPEAERLLGRSRREMLGLGAAELFRPPGAEPEPAAPHPIQAVAATGRRYRSEDETFRRKDGTAFPVGVTAAPLASDGAPIGAVVSFRDMTDIKAYQEEIRRLAYHDPLTDLPNRRLLLELIRQALKEAERKQAKVGLMFLDLDHFKHVNDVYGHDGGDELLKGVAQRLRQAVRAVDTVSRQGGDEFVILLPGIDDADSAVTVARKILESLQAPLPVLDQLLPVKVSIGIALFPDHGGDVDTLMTLADTAMYEAKQGGRNRYCLAGTAPGTL